MKALSLAAILSLGIAGTACSQAKDTAAPAAEAEPAQASTSGSFNLALPDDLDSAETANTNGFNLDLPTGSPTSTDGFNLGTDVAASNGLADLPEIESSIIDTVNEAAPEATTEDDEPIIRLE